jgi:Acetyl-CoA dehydrogenase C-terminal like
MQALAAEIQTTITRAVMHPDLVDYAQALSLALRRTSMVTQQLYTAGDLNVTLANASLYLEAFGHTVVAWIWLEQALLSVDKQAHHDANFYAGKLQACKYFYQWELPKVHQQLDLLASLDTTTLDMQDAWF